MKYYKQGDSKFSLITERGFIQVLNRKSFSSIRAGSNPEMINDIRTHDLECTKEEFEIQYQIAASKPLEVLGI